MGTIIILKTGDKNYYICYTNGSMEEHIIDQKTNPKNPWLQKHSVTRCVYAKHFKTNMKLENHYEYEKFRLYHRKGINRVRTMEFSDLEICEQQQVECDELIAKYTDKVYMEINEFGDRVYPDPQCNRCGRDNHYTTTCYAHQNMNNEVINAPKSTATIRKEYNK